MVKKPGVFDPQICVVDVPLSRMETATQRRTRRERSSTDPVIEAKQVKKFHLSSLLACLINSSDE
ncbi:hypothetical protein AGABI2DRAFT_195778 [Agaricus bisporus var. bisporus H97]|uniref:hypothetical protein n=1 Tax=Agaricus bisporus var. bisporus (strain H97 / ATCC MYA-4626 / FGSC 10389) TaxID=936046 RepID=UPI00029F55D1|nr:hypothetical protein AGABI2DRAFT_195778 [Agaricus bisporus var. bisporus H97]EKV42437.1 hypothetical protein AGABI2DRAFT_195778 [Agaricus bisporus var. bisporus H97]